MAVAVPARRYKAAVRGLLSQLGAAELSQLPVSERAVVTRAAACQVELEALLEARIAGADTQSDFVRVQHAQDLAIKAFHPTEDGSR